MPTFPSYAPASRTTQPDPQSGGRQQPQDGVLPFNRRGRGGTIGKQNPTSGTPAFGGGGPVGGDPADAAFAYGRRKMGLPVDFEKGNTPSFDDGGVVPDPSAVPAQPEAVDPESALKYLSGDGALSPDVILAMEAMADPDNSMDATDRLETVLGRAPSPDVAFGVLQHHRTKYNGYMAAARVAAEKGDYAKAASYLNKGHESVPGSRRRFSPGMGGVNMHDGQAPQAPQEEAPQEQAFGQGGSVDSSNPENVNDSDSDQSFADGGDVEQPDTRYDDMPESINVEDRRGERGEGWTPKDNWTASHDGPTPEGAGKASLDRYDDWKRGAINEGVISKKQKSFDGGGEVEQDNTYGDFPEDTAAVTPPSDDDMTTGAVRAPTPTPEYDPMSMLSPEDVARQAAVSYDAAAARAKASNPAVFNPMGGAPKPSEDLLSGRSYGRRIYEMMPGGNRTYRASPTTGAPAAQSSNGPARVSPTDQAELEAEGNVRPQPGVTRARGEQVPVNPGEEDEARMSGFDPVTKPPAGETQRDDGSKSGQPSDEEHYKLGRQRTDERRDQALDYFKKRAEELWPGRWSHDNEKRNNYIEHNMERFFNHDILRENELTRDRAGTADRAQRDKMIGLDKTINARDANSQRAAETKRQIAAYTQTEMGRRFDRGQEASTLRAAIMAGADISDPKVTQQYRDALERNSGIKVQPDRDTMAEILGLNRSIVKPQGQEGGEIRVGAQRINPKDGSLVTRQQDGTWK